MRASNLLLACGLLAGATSAQSSSPGYQMFDPALASYGGPSSSASGASSFVVQPSLGAGGMSSPAFGAGSGFLETNEPEYPDGPVIFGSTPLSGTGGTTLTISGVHFDYLGAGGTLAVFVGNERAGAVSVLSDTLLTCEAPAVPPGVHTITVSTTFGFDERPFAFIARPALVTSVLAVGGGTLELASYGSVGSSFLLLCSFHQQPVVLPGYGTLLLGPDIFVLGSPQPYPAPDGIARLVVDVPDDPVLDGLQIHFQALSMTPPASNQLTNASTTQFLAPP